MYSGGGRKLDEQSGQMIQKADQDRSAFALGFQRAMEAKSPVAIIAGKLVRNITNLFWGQLELEALTMF